MVFILKIKMFSLDQELLTQKEQQKSFHRVGRS